MQMKGNNKLELCYEEVAAAIQHYLNCDVFRLGHACRVVSVANDVDVIDSLEVTIQPLEESNP